MPAFQKATTIVHGGSITVGATGAVWTISASGQVARNGVTDPYTNHVVELAYSNNGTIWQENSAGLWYAWVGKNAPGNYHGWSAGTYTAPVAEARTWIGGGDNHANRIADWSPHGVPQPGDTLTMASGTTMNLTGNQLAGDPLNLSNGPATETINISGVANLVLNDGSGLGGTNAVVNLAAHSEWIGGFHVSPMSHFAAHGTGTFDNNAASSVNGSATIDPSIVGKGTITAAGAHLGSGRLEFVHGVGAGQTINISSGKLIGGGGVITVDDVKDFHATTNLSIGDLLLKGVTASSYKFEGNALILNTTKGALDLTVNNTTGGFAPLPAGTAIGVFQLAGGVLDITKGGGFGGTPVPLHA